MTSIATEDGAPDLTAGASRMRRRRALRLGYAVTAVSVLGASSIAPVLPVIGHAFGVDAAATALLVSLFILPMAVLTLPVGHLADRVSLRPILIASLLLYGAAGLACAAAPNFATLLALRIVQGCGAAALELFGLVILVEAAGPARLHAVIGRNAAVIGLSVTVAPLLSGLLSLISWRATFLVAAAALPLAYAAIGHAGGEAAPKSAGRPILIDFLRKPPVWKALITTLVVFLYAFGVLLAFVPDQAVAVGVRSGLLIAVLPASSAIAIGAVAPNMERVSRRFGECGVGSLAMLAYLSGSLAFLLARGFPMLEVGAVLFGVGHGLLFPLSQMMLARAMPPERSVVFLSLNIAAMGVGQTLAPLLMSLLYAQLGLRSVFTLAIAVAVALMPLCWIMLGHPGRRGDAATAGVPHGL